MTTAVRPATPGARLQGEKMNSATLPGIRLNPDGKRVTRKVGIPVARDVVRVPHLVPSRSGLQTATATPSKLHRIHCYVRLHRGGWNYIEPYRCDQIRHCPDCEGVSTRTKHGFEWRWVSEKNCQQYQMCTTCDFNNKSREQHSWSGWNSSGNLSTQERRKCSRCERSESRAVSNDPDYY